MNQYNQILKLLQTLSDEQINNLLAKTKIDSQINDEENINVENLLKELCVNPCILGFNYLKEAIEICLENPTMICGITKILYPTIAKKYKTTSPRVERAIRHAIETSWGKISGDIYEQIFYNELEKPTNSKYIAYICSYIKNAKEISNKQPQKIYR